MSMVEGRRKVAKVESGRITKPESSSVGRDGSSHGERR